MSRSDRVYSISTYVRHDYSLRVEIQLTEEQVLHEDAVRMMDGVMRIAYDELHRCLDADDERRRNK